jgi:uroporphyrinogen-III synthase
MDAPDVPFSHVAILHRASGIVASSRTLNEILAELVRLVAEITSSDACLVYLLDQENNEIVLRASQLPHAAEVGALRLRLGEGVTGWVAQQKSVVSLPSAASRDSRFIGVPALVEDTYRRFSPCRSSPAAKRSASSTSTTRSRVSTRPRRSRW